MWSKLFSPEVSVMLVTRFLLALCSIICAPLGCAQTPTAFRADSAANPTAPAAPRLPVATILAEKDPLAARVCPESGPCALPSGATPPAPAESDHHHHHHHH
ncbi:MAG: hypothetical protein IPM54_19345 [Polyangiaceae bacterium]|nr:hypothetical protein [Polyangiaceae bacterium]